MRRKIRDINGRLKKAMENMNVHDDQLKEFEDFAEQYKDKPQQEIEEEMKRLISGFSQAEKKNLIQKLQILKQMDLLDGDQQKKVDIFIHLLSN